MTNQLMYRREERRIAFMISDGSFNERAAHAVRKDGNTLACDIRDEENKEQFDPIKAPEALKKAWAEGIEVYYIGLQISPPAIASAEEWFGKGHVFNLCDIGTELPPLIEDIIGQREGGLGQIKQDKGYKLATRKG